MQVPEGHGVGRHRGDIEDLAWACLRKTNEAPEWRPDEAGLGVFRVKSRKIGVHDAFRSRLMHSVVYYPGQDFGIVGEYKNGVFEECPTDGFSADMRMLELSQRELGVHDLRKIITEAECEISPGVVAEVKTAIRMYDNDEGFERASISVVWPAFDAYVVDQSMRLYIQGASGIYPSSGSSVRIMGGPTLSETDPEQILATEEVRQKFGCAALRGFTTEEAYNIVLPEERFV